MAYRRAVKGFTLLETVIAMGIILFGLVSVVMLMLSSNTASKITSDEFVGINLAREGVEAVRAKRDANWLSGAAYDNGIKAGNSYVFSNFDTSASPVVWLSDGLVDDFSSECDDVNGSTYQCAAVWYYASAQRYFQTTRNDFNPASFTSTFYSRLITAKFICRASDDTETVQNATCDSGKEQVGVAVTVEVRWRQGTDPASYILEEHLYDWK